MESKINKELETLSSSIGWVKANLEGERQKKAYNALVKKRRELKKIKYALSENPAAVLYGESQKGKSYLVGSLLSTTAGSFSILDSANNVSYDFIADINPIGGGKESTSLVTRFTTRSCNSMEGFPVKVKLLSITDMILVLCDTYWSDVKNQTPRTEEQVKERIELLKSKIQNQKQTYMDEDDVMDIGGYCEAHFRSTTSNLIGLTGNANYFYEISQIISKIPISDWKYVFSILWNDNEQITKLFENLLNNYLAIDFVNEVYVPFEAILREGEDNRRCALLDVERLKELNETSKRLKVKYLKDRCVSTKEMEASYLCALASEVILQLPKQVEEEKHFLKGTDILDFPGARARLQLDESQIGEAAENGDKNIPQMLLRGKVAYLFNKYANNYMINTLLFCHDKDQSAQRLMPELLKNWIERVIGDSKEKREEFVNDSKISPLFVIATKFNLDLEFDNINDGVDRKQAQSNRWQTRFVAVYSKELFGEDNTWLDNWTTSRPFFNNFYLLRDYAHAAGKIYDGWNNHGGREEREIPVPSYPNFREDLKDSFVNHDFVKKHFDNPNEAWNEAASMNKDGSELIIKNLTIAAENINVARNNDFKKKLNALNEDILAILAEFYHSDNSDENLRKAKEKAGKFIATLHIKYADQSDPYFFGTFIQNLMIPEGKINELVHDYFQEGIDGDDHDENMSQYAFLWMHVPQLSVQNTFDENLQVLTKAYSLSSTEDCKAFFEEKGIDLDKLFNGAGYVTKDRSYELSVIIQDFWLNEWLGAKREILDGMVGSQYIDDLNVLFANLYDKYRLREIMEMRIRKYVDKSKDYHGIEDLISDMCAELINKFVSSVGADFMSEAEVNALKVANDKQHLDIRFDVIDEKYRSVAKKEDVADILSEISSLHDVYNVQNIDKLKIIPGVMNENRWAEYLKVGFIQTQDIPNYDPIANASLGKIIESCKTISY